jgi:hypothetical protein
VHSEKIYECRLIDHLFYFVLFLKRGMPNLVQAAIRKSYVLHVVSCTTVLGTSVYKLHNSMRCFTKYLRRLSTQIMLPHSAFNIVYWHGWVISRFHTLSYNGETPPKHICNKLTQKKACVYVCVVPVNLSCDCYISIRVLC